MIWSLSLYTRNGKVFIFSAKYTKYRITPGSEWKSLYDLDERTIRGWTGNAVKVEFKTAVEIYLNDPEADDDEPWKQGDEPEYDGPLERDAIYYISFDHIFAHRVIYCTEEEVALHSVTGPTLIP